MAEMRQRVLGLSVVGAVVLASLVTWFASVLIRSPAELAARAAKTFTLSALALACVALVPAAAQAQAVKLTLGHGAAPGRAVRRLRNSATAHGLIAFPILPSSISGHS